MFLAWSLVTVNVLLAVFQFLLIGTIGAILAIYSRFGGDYANSIRWSRQGGYPEMLSSVYNSWIILPRSTKIAISLTICASLSASLADKGAAYFIAVSDRQTNASYITVKTSQFLPFYNTVQEPSGWTFSIRHGADIADAMAKKINDTSNIPNAVPGRMYVPQTSEYESCNQLAVKTLDHEAPQLHLRSSGCMEVNFMIAMPFHLPLANATHLKRSKDRWSIITPTIPSQWLGEIPIMAALRSNASFIAFLMTMNDMTVTRIMWMELEDGLTSFPETIVSKGLSPAGETFVLSVTTIPFSTSTVQRFRNVSTAVFGNYNAMFEAMETSVNNATFRSTTNLFIEVKLDSTSVEMLACYTSPVPGLMCSYIIISTVVTKPQALNPIITEARQGRPLSQLQGVHFSVAMRIRHTIAAVDGTRQSISTSTIKDATSAAAHYLASLGQNFYMDWDASQLYVIYDTTDTQGGLEIPSWLIWSIAVIMIVCLCFWAATEYFLDERYLSSLQKNIALHLGTRLPGTAPMVMRSQFDTLEFEDVPILSQDIQLKVDT
ncbi:hypothetical protein BGZ72_000695 [Mortierella alpina]|nr:hypothetical protein BGZ72_000695 [Mortierella alpina]